MSKPLHSDENILVKEKLSHNLRENLSCEVSKYQHMIIALRSKEYLKILLLVPVKYKINPTLTASFPTKCDHIAVINPKKPQEDLTPTTHPCKSKTTLLGENYLYLLFQHKFKK